MQHQQMQINAIRQQLATNNALLQANAMASASYFRAEENRRSADNNLSVYNSQMSANAILMQQGMFPSFHF
jgi:hypothetical protein